MTIELLRSFAATRLPTTVRDEATIDLIRLLRAADCLAALTSPPRAPAPFASVLCVTAKGWRLLAQQGGAPSRAPARPEPPMRKQAREKASQPARAAATV